MSGDDESRLFAAINAARAAQGLPALSHDPRAEAAARAQARDMAQNRFMGHGGSDGSGPAQRLEHQGYRWSFVAENLSFNYPSPEATVEGWMTSPGHRANILAPEARDLGVARADGALGPYRAAVFAAPL
ncbi:CAP domain-containing protein [Pseudooceanicola sp. CBS1P-1]|uniref:CAP domain-containing protein n=1 Tax=Pseudooceanicola albus TaxID=2692189 RepID=A0A6L7G4T8_9RHOB|nr:MULTISPECIES: CAP domain-containing protein [Pseudooceanicola]MBT9384689.1 CAP domain-containing protein [Pseudooceanicola endophyticus]MXN18390.1 CAP domain-containing protein [Pseudooceanicola albus]